MRPMSEALRRAIVAAERRYTMRVSVLDTNLNPVPGGVLSGADGVVFDGSVIIDRRRPERRTCSFSAVNQDGALTPNTATSLLHWTRMIRVERGTYVTPTEIEWTEWGVFHVDEPEVTVTGSSATISVVGRDRMKVPALSELTTPLTLAAGSRVADGVKALLVGSGMNPGLYRLDDAGQTLAASRTLPSGTNRLDAAMKLASEFGLELFADARGYIMLRPLIDPNTQQPVWTFARGSEAIMLGIRKATTDASFRNQVVVVGEGPGFATVRAVAQLTNPEHPGNVNSGIGIRTKFITSADIRTLVQAQRVADSTLPTVALVEEAIEVPSLVHPCIEAGDVVWVREERSATNDRILLDQVVLPMRSGAMRFLAARVVPMR